MENRAAFRDEAIQRFRETDAWRAEAIRLRKETDLSIIEIAKRVGVGKNRVAPVVRGINPPPRNVVSPEEIGAKPKVRSGLVRVGGALIRRYAGESKRKIQPVDEEKAYLSKALSAESGQRKPPPVTLPRVSILEGVEW